MKKILLLLSLFILAILSAKAETAAIDTGKAAAPAPPDPPLVFSGSVDTYWKYDFSGMGNIPTSFANEQNSISIGMIDLGLKKTVG
ncbi:MAG: porin, partial [Mucilaginibacter sp.]